MSTTPTAKTTRVATLLACSLASFMVGLDALVVTTVLPNIRHDFGTGIDNLSWVVNAYALAFAVSILAGSMLGDRFGRRRMLTVGVALFALASALCALAPTLGVLVAARTVQGAAGGVCVPLALAIVTAATPAERRGKVIGIWGAITGIAVAIGPLIGGLVAQGLAWQWVFWLNLPVAAVILILARRIPADAPQTGRADLLGLALATLGIALVTHALARVSPASLSDASLWGEVVAGLVLVVGFARWERRAAAPLVPPALFRHDGFLAACIAMAALGAGLFGTAYLLAQYIQAAITPDPLGVGLALLPWTGLAVLVAPVVGRLSDKIGEAPLLALGLALQSLGAILLAVTASTNYTAILVPLIVSGLGVAIAFPASATALMRTVPAPAITVASGVGNAFRQVGAALGIAVAVAVFAFSGGGLAHPDTAITGFQPAMLALAGFGLIGTLAATRLIATRRAARQTSSTPESVAQASRAKVAV
ncbi:MFS transporter [Tessaracoccus caeni]|uniref:MFS transporter n=1 Tax=Tessaracoccus caeni TaxID=3031239 RepID=UPI0023DA3F73|nr:MFS transporter [Tessaracoccus caeni]MDF1489652.1 MFS transporter [Tessaracoccus caeni]